MTTILDKVKHVIVVMLENRSFDHMLGWLVNPNAMPAQERAKETLGKSPDHSHRGVMWQLLGHKPLHLPAPTGPITMDGFAASYDSVWRGHGSEVLRGFMPDQVPVLSALASGFAVCTRWFCSLPGQTWPNRNFAHAGTSDGDVNIVPRLYRNPTIFERIEAAGKAWRVYHEGPAEIWCFPALWSRESRNRYGDHADLLSEIRNDQLPEYAFVEPDHGLIFREAFESSDSQHPANNPPKSAGRDFLSGEWLLHYIYTALASRRGVFEKTLLVVTYDEHGGFADHVPPPSDAVAPDDEGKDFHFTLLGPRVPTLLVSPWIPSGLRLPNQPPTETIDFTFDHCAIPRTVRELFAPGSAPLSRREAVASMFLPALSLDAPRPDLPVTRPRELPVPRHPDRVMLGSAALAGPPRPLDDFQQSLVELAQLVDQALRTEAARPLALRADIIESVLASPPPPRVFTTEAERQLYLYDVTRRLQRQPFRP